MAKRDGSKHESGLTEFFKKAVDMQKTEKIKDSDFICSELAISNKKGVYLTCLSTTISRKFRTFL